MKRKILFWVLIASVAALATFFLPFLFPLKQPVFTPVYTVGGNNRVGALAAAVVSVVTALLCWRLRFFQPLRESDEPRKSPARVWLWIAMATVTAYVAVIGVLMARLRAYYADAGYFLTQLRTGLVFHGVLYRDFEFAYGPLLYHWPAAFMRVLSLLHVSPAAAYVVSLCAMEAVGTAMLFYAVSAMPMRRSMQLAAFLLLTLLTLDPQEGLNYTAFRFICSISALVLLSRQQTIARASLVAFAGALLTFAISPEMGVAFAAASAVYGCYRALSGGARWLWLLGASAAGSALFAAVVGPDYFRTLKEFANGGYNMLLEPAPHIYFLLLCAIGLAPMAVAAALASNSRSDTARAEVGLLLGTYIAGLALLPAALGRCDPLHVSFNGWPLFLLSFVTLDRMRLPARRIGLAVALLFCIYSVTQEYALGSGAVKKLIAQQTDPSEIVDMPRLLSALHGQRVAFPWFPTFRTAEELTAAGLYQPMYLCIDAVDRNAEMRTVHDMREVDYVMAPNVSNRVTENPINNVGIKYRLRFGYRFKAKHAPFMQNQLLADELEAHWQRIGTFGSYDLYHRIS